MVHTIHILQTCARIGAQYICRPYPWSARPLDSDGPNLNISIQHEKIDGERDVTQCTGCCKEILESKIAPTKINKQKTHDRGKLSQNLMQFVRSFFCRLHKGGALLKRSVRKPIKFASRTFRQPSSNAKQLIAHEPGEIASPFG